MVLVLGLWSMLLVMSLYILPYWLWIGIRSLVDTGFEQMKILNVETAIYLRISLQLSSALLLSSH